MNIVLLGAPGAGKGTQAQKLETDFSFSHIATGDLLRSALKAGTDLGKKAKSYMDQGIFVPDEVVIGLVKEKLTEKDCQKGFILDGFPRNTSQADALDEELLSMGITLDAALLVSVNPEIIVNRLSSRRVCRDCGYTASLDFTSCPKCGGELYQRVDDKPETVRQRLEVYSTQTKPLIEYYRERGILKEVNGERSVDTVYADVKDLLGL